MILEEKYPGIKGKIEKSHNAGYTDEMIENNIKRLIYKSYSHDYTEDMIRANLGVSKDFELPEKASWWQKGVELMTGGHIEAPGPPPEPEFKLGIDKLEQEAEGVGPTIESEKRLLPKGKITVPETAGMGFFEDPVTALAFGALSGAKVAGPIGKKLFIAGREALAWATGGLTDAPKLAAMGAEKVAGGVAAKQLEKTMAGAFERAAAGIGTKRLAPKVAPKLVKPGARVMELVKKRRTDIDTGILDSEFFVRDIERRLTPPSTKGPYGVTPKPKQPITQPGKVAPELTSQAKWGMVGTKEQNLEAVPFLIQGTKDSMTLNKIGRGDLIPIIQRPSKELLSVVNDVKKYYAESHEFLKQAWGDDIGFVENYVTQLWDIPKARKGEVLNYFAKNNPFLKQRKIPTLEEGIALGLKPKTTNIADLLRIYDQYKIKTVHNMKFAESLKGLADDNGVPLIMRSDKAPVDWVKIDHPAMNRAMAIGTKPLLLSKVPVKVNPEISREVKVIFDEPINNKWINAFEVTNAFLKKSMLSASLFHHQALTESALSAGIGHKVVKLWNPAKIIKELRNKNYSIFQEMDLTKDAIKHNVTFGALEDIQRGRVVDALKSVEDATKNIPALNKITKGAGKANKLWDAALWDYYHNSLKLYAYETNVAKSLKIGEKSAQKQFGRSLNPEETEKIKDTIGLFINDSFGGQNWELNSVLGNPKVRQMMQWFWLAPDWTISVLKQAAAPVKGAAMMATAKGDIPKALAGKALAKRGSLFWARAALYYNIIAQGVNYQTTKKEYGKGRFTWDNTPGNKLNIFIGRNEDGTERYLRMGKQFREVIEWGEDPLKKTGAKLSPLLREGIRQFSAHDPGSGYPTEWAEKDSFWKTIPERLKSVAEMPIPFSLRSYVTSRPGVFMFTFPTKKGMTNYKTVKLFKEAIKDKDKKEVKKLYIHALENNLNAYQLLKTASSAVKADMTYDDKGVAKDILNEMNGMTPEAKKDAYNLYKKRGTITPNIEKQMERLIKNRAEIAQQKALLK